MIFRNSEQQIHERIREEIRSRLVSTQVPEEVEVFLLRHWSDLLRGIYLSRGGEHADWQAGWDTVDALLWSLTPKQNRQETERLLRLLPILLGRLQEGCLALGMPERETEALFNRLAGLHAALARAGLQAIADQEGQQASGSDGGFDPGAATAQTASDAQPAVGRASLAALQPGDWVAFHCADGDKRLRLQWVSASGGMFLFADSQGLDALSLTRSRLQERLARGELAIEV